MRKAIVYIVTLCVIAFVTQYIKLNIQQSISVIIFLSFILGSLFYWPFRNAFALAGVSLLLAFRVLDIEHLIEFASLDIILFLVGMMTVIGYLEDKGFFDWLIGVLSKPFVNKPRTLLFVLLCMASIMAALVDEVTSILFMMAVMLRTLRSYRVEGEKVLPFIMFLVFTTNLGSSALPVGNPIGVMVAFRAGLTALDFIRWPMPLMILNTLLTSFIGVLLLTRVVKLTPRPAILTNGGEGEEVKFSDLKVPFIIFISVIAGLVMHHYIEEVFHMPKNTLLLAIPLIGAGVVLFVERKKARDLIEKKVDWWTLLYFLLLFSSVGTLKYVGVTDLIAKAITELGGDLMFLMLLMGGVAGILTAFMDNVLAVATLIPVVYSIGSTSNVPLEPIWWMLLIGGTYCGNATIIGSTANIIAAGYVEKRGYGSFSMLKWILIGTPISIVTFLIAYALLYLQYQLIFAI